MLVRCCTEMLGILRGAWRMRHLSRFAPSDRLQIPRWIPLCLAAYVFAGGLVSLMGWALDIPRLADWGDYGIATQPNAAVVAMICGAALLSLHLEYRRTAASLGMLVAIISSLTLFEYLTGAELNIDTVMMFDRQWGQLGALSPGRMGPPGSLAWTLAGMALLLSSCGGKSRKIISMVGIAIVVIAALSLTGYLFGVGVLYQLPLMTTIAAQTATLIMATGLSLIISVPEREPMRTLLDDSAAGIMVRRTLPFVIALPIVVGYLELRGLQLGRYDAGLGTTMLVMTLITLMCAVLAQGVRAVRAWERVLNLANDAIARTEKKLTESRALIEAVNSGTPDLIFAKDREGRISYMNEAARVLVGKPLSQVLGRTELEIAGDTPFSRMIMENDQQVMTRAQTESVEEALVDGRTFLITKSPLRDSGGNILGLTGVGVDVTERKRMEQKLRDADRRKDEFLATLAHELRNPLAPITNALSILDRAGNNAWLIEQARSTMGRQVAHMVRLIDDLLDISRITLDKLELRTSTLELAPIIHHAVEACRPLIERAGHQLSINMPNEPVYLTGDSARLAQIFGNLLTNACKYTEREGRIGITVSPGRTDVAISIKDSGVGIPQDMLPLVFDMFVQVGRTIERTEGGLGIGLSLAKRLGGLYGGTLTVQRDGLGRR